MYEIHWEISKLLLLIYIYCSAKLWGGGGRMDKLRAIVSFLYLITIFSRLGITAGVRIGFAKVHVRGAEDVHG